LCIADHVNTYDGVDGEARPGIARLAAMTRSSVKTVRRHIKKLEDLGELFVDRDSDRYATNTYVITLDPSQVVRTPKLGGLGRVLTHRKCALSTDVPETSTDVPPSSQPWEGGLPPVGTNGSQMSPEAEEKRNESFFESLDEAGALDARDVSDPCCNDGWIETSDGMRHCPVHHPRAAIGR
jgi:hypothetical protein